MRPVPKGATESSKLELQVPKTMPIVSVVVPVIGLTSLIYRDPIR